MKALAHDRPIETRRGTIALSIKRLTAHDHRVAERAVAAVTPFASPAAYRSYLAKLELFYAAIEPPLFAWLALPDAAERRKLGRLRHDLAALGGTPFGASIARPRVPRIRSLASALGVGYVLEGKTLGSRFLLEEARASGFTTGTAFLAGYGERTGSMWRTYLGALDGFVRANGRRAAIVDAARATFACFTAWVATSPESG